MKTNFKITQNQLKKKKKQVKVDHLWLKFDNEEL